MKSFACGAVVPHCTATFTAETEDELLAQVATHANAAHGIAEVSDDLVVEVRRHVVTVA